MEFRAQGVPGPQNTYRFRVPYLWFLSISPQKGRFFGVNRQGLGFRGVYHPRRLLRHSALRPKPELHPMRPETSFG